MKARTKEMRIGKNRTSTILIEFFLFFIFLFIVSIMSTEASSEWYLSDNICLQFDRTKSCEIINDKGEILKYDADKDMISGNIQVEFKAKSETKMLNKNYRERCSKKVYKVWINEDSDNFVFIPLEDGENYFSVYYKDNSGAKIIASNSKEVQIAKSYFSVEGENCKYAITEANFTDYGEKYKYEKRYNIYGTTNNKVTLSRVLDDEAILSGVRNTYFWVDVKYPVYDEEDCYKYKDNACDKLYSFEDIVNIAVDTENEGKLIVAGTCNLCETQYTNKILTRYLEEANDDNDMLFTWNTVKNAKSYVIYQYNSELKKYTKKDVIKDQDTNYYLIPVTKNKKIYKFKIAACSDTDGKHILGNISTPVSAVSSDNKKSNVIKIHLNKKLEKEEYIDIDLGKKLKIKAKLFGKDGKKLLSKNIEWVSTSKKVVSISKNGVVTGKKFLGSCEVWARAHNGVESMHLKITVF